MTLSKRRNLMDFWYFSLYAYHSRNLLTAFIVLLTVNWVNYRSLFHKKKPITGKVEALTINVQVYRQGYSLKVDSSNKLTLKNSL